MSITDELREWGNRWEDAVADEIDAIADRIDAEHKNALYEPMDRDLTEHGWVKLPVDADGKVIHVEDEVELLDGSNRFKAEWLEWDGEDWAVHETIGYGAYHEPSSLRHRRKPTVEDVLREFAERICSGDHAVINGTYRGLEDLDLLAEYAAKLRLAGDAV